jgi:DNA-binding transcriptional LysR family regulator
MDRLESMSVFVAVVEAGGFSAAARKLGMPLATVSRKMSELERHLNISLINRSTRRIKLTDTGQAFFETTRRLLDELREAERTAAGEFLAPRGELVITATIVFGRIHAVPIIAEFLKAYPEIDVRLVLKDHVIDLLEEQVDVAIRIGHLPDSSLVAVKVGAIRYVVSASPTYLAEHGSPLHPRDLGDHVCIARTVLPPPDAWPFRIGKSVKTITIRPRLTVTTAEAAIEAAIAGIGVVRSLNYQVFNAEQDGRLVRLLRAYETDPIPVSIVYPSGPRIASKLRAFLDFAVPRMKERLANRG